MADPERGAGELWMEMTQYGHVNGENHPVVGAAGRDMMDRPEEEAGSVLSTAKSYLALSVIRLWPATSASHILKLKT